MFRFSQDTDSSRTSSTKSFINSLPNTYFQQSMQKPFPFNISEIPTQKPHKKGIATIMTHTLQNTKDQPQEKINYTSRKSQSVYDQYVKTLQIEIASRERQRMELHRSLQEIKRQNGAILHDLHEQRKKSAGFQMKVEQMDIFLKQNEDKRKALNNQKDQLFKQYQFQNQRRKAIEQNEQKLRFQLESAQFQSTSKINQYFHTTNKVNQQNNRIKQHIQRLTTQIKNLELNNESYKKQLNDVFLQKTKIIDSILVEKQFIENQLQKQKSQHQQLKNFHKQKQETVKNLNKKMMDLQQSKESEKSQLTFEANQMQLENQNIKKNYEMAKQNFKRQLQTLVTEGNRVRQIITQLEKDKKVDRTYITELERQIQQLQKQKSSEIQQKLQIKDQLQKYRRSYEQQRLTFNLRIQHLETNLQQKSKQLEQLNKKNIELQSELQLTKYRNSHQKELLLGEISFLKQQISAQSNQFSSQSTKLIQERQKLQRYFNDELSKSKLQANQKIRLQKQTLQKQFQVKLQDNKVSYQNNIKTLQNKIDELKNQIHRNNQLYNLEKQKILQQNLIQSTKKLSILQTNSLHAFQQKQGQLKKELHQKNSLIKSLNQEIKVLNEQISKLFTDMQNLRKQLKDNKEKYEMQEAELIKRLQKEQSQLREQILFDKKRSQLEKQQMKKQADKTCYQLQSEISSLKLQLRALNQEKQNIASSLHTLENSSSMSTSQMRTQIMTLQLQKNQLQELLSFKEQQLNRQQEKFTQQINMKIEQHQSEKKQLQNYIDSIAHSLNSVIQFVQKYSGQSLKSGLIRLNSCDQNLYNIYQTSRTHCQQLTNFIGERLYALTVLMQENSQLKCQIDQKNKQIFKLQESLSQFTSQNASLDQQRMRTLAQLSQLKESLQMTNLENFESISKLKQHVEFYKNQLNRYESQFQVISTKIQEHQGLSLQSQTKIIELEQQITHYKGELQKLSNKHKLQISSLVDKKKRQISLIQEEHQSHIKLINSEFQQKIIHIQNEIISYQEKLKQFEKIIDNKNHQYQELQNHYNLIIQRLNQQHQTRIHQYQRELQFLNKKISTFSNQELLIKKIQILQDQLHKKERQLKIVEENNALLRKNFINSLAEQENLRQEMKQNKSQNSATKSQSKDKSRRDTSQQLKNKYLLRKSSQAKINKQLNSIPKQMTLSLTHHRSYSNTQLNARKYQTPRSSQKNISPLNLSTVQKSQRIIETQRPVSNLQRSAPHIPLDLKKIRERNQLYFNSQNPSKLKNSCNQIKPQNSKQSSQSPLILITPIKMVDVQFEDQDTPENQN